MQNALTILRNKKTSTDEFRVASQVIARGLAQDVLHHLPECKTSHTQGIVVVPILRSGVALLDSFLEVFTDARVGFVGLKRDEKTLKPKAYYQNIPTIKKSDLVIVLDPMLATGGSAVAGIRTLVQAGAHKENIVFAGVIAAPQGIEMLRKHFPDITIVLGVCDKGLDKKGYIVPGVGDFGDRYFGTK